MKLYCQTEEQFYAAIYAAVTSGLTFEADAVTLTITYTGGY